MHGRINMVKATSRKALLQFAKRTLKDTYRIYKEYAGLTRITDEMIETYANLIELNHQRGQITTQQDVLSILYK
jgi:hypothetical protein